MALSNSTDRFNGVLSTLAIKAPCAAVAIANITLSGEQTVNGVAVVAGDRVLVTAQTSAVDNGIYDVSSSAWTRSADFDGNRDVVSGTFVTVATATVGRNPYYQITTANPITIGNTAINFTLADGPNVSFALTADEIAFGLTDNDIDDSFEPLNVLRYGADGTGSAIDDTQPFKDAIGSIPDWTTTGSTEQIVVGDFGGGTIIVPTGDYLITDTLLYKSGMTFQAGGKGTILRFAPTSAKDFFSVDTTAHFKSNTTHFVRWHGFSIIGDRNLVTLAGNAGVAINLGKTIHGVIVDCHINSWDIGVKAAEGAGVSSFYNKVENCKFIYNRRHIVGDVDATVFMIVDSVLVKHANTTATVDYQIESVNSIYMVGGSLEGNTIDIAHVGVSQGRFINIGTHIDGGTGPVLEVKHDGVAGTVALLNPLGGQDAIVLRDMFVDPVAWWDQDHNSAGYLVSNSGGNFIARTLNSDFRYGLQNWSQSPAEGFLTYLQDRADLFMFDSGIYMEKTSTSNHSLIRQFMKPMPEAECFSVVLVQQSDDAILNMVMLGPQGQAKHITVATFGDPASESRWELMVAWLPYYSLGTIGSSTIGHQIGLITASPIGSWVKFTGVQLYAGGYPLLPCKKHVYETVTAKPTQGHPAVGERVYDVTPAVGSQQGWACAKRSDTTLSSGTTAPSAVIAVADSTGWAVGDTIGVDLDNRQQHWSTIASLGPITLNDNFPSDAASGKKVTQHLYIAMPNF